jgi:hypothetical protein
METEATLSQAQRADLARILRMRRFVQNEASDLYSFVMADGLPELFTNWEHAVRDGRDLKNLIDIDMPALARSVEHFRTCLEAMAHDNEPARTVPARVTNEAV